MVGAILFGGKWNECCLLLPGLLVSYQPEGSRIKTVPIKSSRLCTVAGSTCQTDILSGARNKVQCTLSRVLMKPVLKDLMGMFIHFIMYFNCISMFFVLFHDLFMIPHSALADQVMENLRHCCRVTTLGGPAEGTGYICEHLCEHQ